MSKRMSGRKLLLWLLALAPLLIVFWLWVKSYSPWTLDVYDAKRHELWTLYCGAIHVTKEYDRGLNRDSRFDVRSLYQGKPVCPEYRLSLCYLTAIALLIGASPAVGLASTRWRRRSRRLRSSCPACGYSLKHNTSGRCPECGEQVDSLPTTRRFSGKTRRVCRVGMLCMCSLVGLLVLVVGLAGLWKPIQFSAGDAPSIVIFESSHGRLGLWQFSRAPGRAERPTRFVLQFAGFELVSLPEAHTSSVPAQILGLRYLIVPLWAAALVFLVWPLTVFILRWFQRSQCKRRERQNGR